MRRFLLGTLTRNPGSMRDKSRHRSQEDHVSLRSDTVKQGATHAQLNEGCNLVHFDSSGLVERGKLLAL